MVVQEDNFIDFFKKAVEKYENIAIIPHYNPDPDALASSFALQYLIEKIFHKKAEIYVSGIIGRAENLKMIELLNINFINLKNEIINQPIMLIDTQPATGNNPVKNKKKIKFVIDHHQKLESSNKIPYTDIRENYGSSSSIVFTYFKALNLKPPINIATALYYGIQTDIVGEGRLAFKIDFHCLEELSALINREKLYAIENPSLSFSYYKNINKGLQNSILYNDFLVTTLGKVENPDFIGEMADFLIRFDKCNLVMVMGVYENFIHISFRSQKKSIHAGKILKKIIGKTGSAGGHSTAAGGRVFFKNNEELSCLNKKIITATLKLLCGEIISGIPFLSLDNYLNP